METPENSNPSGGVGADLTGRELGDYRVLRRLGSGGMAEVYLAEQLSLSRQVALKVLNPALATDANYVQRFKNEARAAASLVHPNIVQIYEVGQADGVHFIAQEYVAGKNLTQLLEREGAFEPALVLDVLRQVAAALCKAHELSIVHRDIKPENILLSNSGEVKVADFGLARVQNNDTKTLTQVGVAMGTPLYMSPEQVEGRPVDARSDIYSLGVSSYHLLAGVPPHTGETALAIAVQHLHNTPEPLENVRSDLPSAMARIVHKMMAKKPDSRPHSPSDLLVELRELAQLASNEGWAAGPEGWSLSELIATQPARSQTSQVLDQLMKAESKLKTSSSTWKRFAIPLVGAVVLGALLGGVTGPRPYLANGPRTLDDVPDQESAWAQLYHAQMYPTEASWQKAVNYPEEDQFVKELAERGLLRYYLVESQEYGNALQRLRTLERSSEGDQNRELLHVFSLAGMCVCHEKLGDRDAAMRISANIDSTMATLLEQKEPQVYRLFSQTRERLQNAEAT